MFADPLRDPLDIAGNIAALDRQRTAIPRYRANRILRNFLNPERRHLLFPTNCKLDKAAEAKGQLTTQLMAQRSGLR
jgi:hypothetical protein